MHVGGALALLLALLVAGCAGSLQHVIQAAPPQVAVAAPAAPASRADLDSLMYAGGPPPVAGVVAPVAAVAVGEPSVYLLDSGDRLRVVVFGQDGLSNSYIVDAAGNITMPLIGAVSARGVSTADLARTIGARLRNGFIREPHVAIEIEAYRPFFILGEVTYPGQYPYVPNMTVETAVAIAGGFTPRAYRWQAKVARNLGGAAARMAVPPTFALQPGDTITIDERWF
jgi:polysaccharide export outer membrane protein